MKGEKEVWMGRKEMKLRDGMIEEERKESNGKMSSKEKRERREKGGWK